MHISLLGFKSKPVYYHRGIRNDPDLRLSPERGNVAFASSDMGYCFTLKSFGDLYAESYGMLPLFLSRIVY